MADSRTMQELWRKQQIGEFSEAGWSERRKATLIGTVKSSYYVPQFRPFDLLTGPNQPLVILENDKHRIGVEAVLGVQDAFHRYLDTDMIYFQFAGSTTLETEMGVFQMAPGDLTLVPAGVAHRSTGSTDSLRYFCRTLDEIEHVMDEDQYTSETSFELRRRGGPDWQIPSGQNGHGAVVERMHRWDDGPDDFQYAERDYEDLVGVMTIRGPLAGKKGVQKRRAFDHYTAVVGKGGKDPGTQYLMTGGDLRIRTYNMMGEQFAFHRGDKSEEIHVQFRGSAIDMCEFGIFEKAPGEVTVMPRGIAHSVISDPPDDESFLRLNFYSAKPWRVPTDPTAHKYNSTFEVATTVHKEADWRLADTDWRAAALR
jgi:mannose-6-phosphate isomerase-like protein (cupin superfamily)